MERKDTIANNLQQILERIEVAVRASGRKSGAVKLIGVSKYVGAEVARDLFNAGCHCLGESRPQVFREKREKMSDLDIEWHLIGHLQRNKIKFVLPHANLIHSVDSLRLLQALENEAEKIATPAKILLEVNISEESAKHGFTETELYGALELANQCQWVRVEGLMGMSSFRGTDEVARREFAQLRKLMETVAPKFNSEHIQLRELSMGMTGDFEIAIGEGATMVRIGSALFEGVQ